MDAIYFADAGTFILGVQVWLSATPASGAAALQRLRKTWPRALPAPGLGTGAFRSLLRGMRFLVFRTPRGKLVVALSCPEERCTERLLLKVAGLVNGRG